MRILIFVMLFLTSCSSIIKNKEILPEPNKPQISHINWSETNIHNTTYYLLDKKNMDILNNNLLNILNYQKEQSSLIHYYENLNK